jgi:hypothetical protein
MTRSLTIVERTVPAADRAAYLISLATRRAAAARVDAHFWVFEHSDEPGRYVEFTEGAGANEIATVHDGELPAPLWREVQGA